MIEKKLILTLIVGFFLNGCGFHTPYKENAVNLEIVDGQNSMFATQIKKKLNNNIENSYFVHLSNETKKDLAASFNNDGLESGINVYYSIDVDVLDSDNKSVFKKKISANDYLRKLNDVNIDGSLIEEKYYELADTLASNFIRQLIVMNED